MEKPTSSNKDGIKTKTSRTTKPTESHDVTGKASVQLKSFRTAKNAESPAVKGQSSVQIKSARTTKPAESPAVKGQSSVQLKSSRTNKPAESPAVKGQSSVQLKQSRTSRQAESHSVNRQPSNKLKPSQKNKLGASTATKGRRGPLTVIALGATCVVSLSLFLGLVFLYLQEQGQWTQEKQKLTDEQNAIESEIGELQNTTQELNKLTTENSEIANDLNELQQELQSKTVEKEKVTYEFEAAKSEIVELQNKAEESRRITAENTLVTNSLEELGLKLQYAITECQEPSCSKVTIDRIPTELRNETGGQIETEIPGVGVNKVYCDLRTDGGKWTVFQRRMNGSVDFNRNWDDYVAGFGNVRGEFWLGLEAIHQLTKNEDQELRIDMITSDGGVHYYAKYSIFKLGSETELYKLDAREYSGNATDAFRSAGDNANIIGRAFTTIDADHDGIHPQNCAQMRGGGWWYYGCAECNLNGLHGVSGYTGMGWEVGSAGRKFIKFSEMKVRKRL